MLRCVATLVFCPPSTDLRPRRRRFPHRLTDAAHFASFSDARQDSDVVRASSRIGRPQLSSALIRRSQRYSKAQVYMVARAPADRGVLRTRSGASGSSSIWHLERPAPELALSTANYRRSEGAKGSAQALDSSPPVCAFI